MVSSARSYDTLRIVDGERPAAYVDIVHTVVSSFASAPVLEPVPVVGLILSCRACAAPVPARDPNRAVVAREPLFPKPIHFLELPYQALAKYGVPIRPLCIFSTASIVCGHERCCVPICTHFLYFC